MTRLWEFHGGVELDGHKKLSCTQPIVPASIPPFLVLPLLQHIGEPAEPIVRIGEKVLKGQIIARCQNKEISAPIHASSSGTIFAIEPRLVPHPSGLMAPCLIIKTDGQDEWIARATRQDCPDNPELVRNHIANSGIVGLGGAGFPAHIKLKSEGIDTLIINGAECEPYITCDDRLMRERPNDIIAGAKIIMHVLSGAKRCIIAIEDNKPEAYQALLAATENQEQIEVVQVPTRYPMGGERQLIQVLTGKEVGYSQLPATIGIVVHNVKTVRAVYQAVQLGEPLLSRIVTVTGDGIEKPKILEVLLGTPMRFLIDLCGRKSGIKKLIVGGSMMGFTLPSDDIPIVKTTNCLIVSKNTDIKTPPEHCIRCGACAEVCPMNLLPQQLYWHIKAKNLQKAQKYHILDCIDCGCCAYVCPSKIPLVDYYRYAKAEIRACINKRKIAERTRQRHEFKTFRLEREKQEAAARLSLAAKKAKTNKLAVIKAAIEKARQAK